MREAILYLSRNPHVFRKIKIGEASLLGVTANELRAILDSTLLSSNNIIDVFWK